MERERPPEPKELPDRHAAMRALRAYEGAFAAAMGDPSSLDRLAAWAEARRALEEVLRRPGKFPLGRTVATRGAVEALREASHVPAEFLIRHKHGDWGELDAEDRRENARSLALGYRLLSAYRTRHAERLWVITEADRSATTLLLPEEY